MNAAAPTLGPLWGLPFAGLLLSIAFVPLFAPAVWHRHSGRIALVWSACFLLPFAATFGTGEAVHRLAHVLLLEYLPFTLLMTALFTTAGGIHVHGDLHGSPGFNTAVLAAGALMASLMGTTGASMLLIRPLLRANAGRRQRAHVVIFFIFLVGNIGGVLTPLGDPPLLLGYLRGVDFFWTARHLGLPMLLLVACLLALFYAIDRYRYDREGHPVAPRPAPDERGPVGIDGAANLLPLALVIALVLLGGMWKTGAGIDILGTRVGLAQIVRDLGLIGATLLSLALTPKGLRTANEFTWAPMQEVAELFAGIFITMVPVLSILSAGEGGAFGPLVGLVTGPSGALLPAACFWVTGLLSAFLDNAPTYLVFFGLAGGDAVHLMDDLPGTLAAISAGAVFMGALTYIGNAPNFMIKAIAERQGVRMPGFFGYMAWSGTMMVPLFALITWWRFA